jgi:hypothetical protein
MCLSGRVLAVGSYDRFLKWLVVGSYMPFRKGVGVRQLCAQLLGGLW